MAIADVHTATEDVVEVDPIEVLAASLGSAAPATDTSAAEATGAGELAVAARDAGQSEPDPEISPSLLIGEAEPVSAEQDLPVAADEPVTESATATAETSAEAPAAETSAEPAMAATGAEAPAAETGVEAAAAVVAPAEVAAPQEDGPAFLAKLARAMHTTVARERARIDEDIERRRAAHLQAVRDRAAADEEGIRALAADEMKAIETWAEGEMKAIKLEREARERAMNDDLELSLKNRGAKTDGEIASAEAAITAYRTQAEGFFADLDREMDPVEIAHRASLHPAFPSLDAPTQLASDTATGDRSGAIGVMGVSSVGGRGLLGAMSFGSRPQPSGVRVAGGEAAQGTAREGVTVPARTGGQASGGDGSPLDSLLAPRSES